MLKAKTLSTFVDDCPLKHNHLKNKSVLLVEEMHVI